MKSISCFCVILALVSLPVSTMAWDPNAGLRLWTVGENVSAIATSSDANHGTNNIIDNDPNTYWMSAGCLPTGYIIRPDLNLIFGACSQGHYSTSVLTVQSDPTDVTDGNLNTAVQVLVQDGKAWFEAFLEIPQVLHAVGARVLIPQGSSKLATISVVT